ncbi:MAG: polysaccharide biosynthesis tyrosine autokinase [Desulfobacteraceae bacterium]|nr:MAG: polysaccharide biosynthesis tyrosine autokinase [Desulfobacteraceae bacterium]
MPVAYDLNLREYWRTIRRRKVIVIFTIFMMTLFSFVFSVLGRPTPIYKTSASVKVEKSDSVTGLFIQTVSYSTTDYMETQTAMIKSYFIMELVAKKMGLIPSGISSDEVRHNSGYLSTILMLKEKVETEQEGNSDIINISANSEDPKKAQRLANTVAQVYKEQHALNLNRRIIEAKKFIESQVVVTKDKLQKSEDTVKAFRETNRMVSLDSQSSGLVSQFSDLQTKKVQDLATYGKIHEILNALARAEKSPLSSKTIFYFEEASAPYKSLNDRLVQLLLDRDIMLITYTENFPQVIETRKQIHEIITSMTAHLKAQQQSLSQAVNLTENQLNNLDDRLKSLPAQGLELARLEREVDVNREIYTMLEKQYQESLIQNAVQIEEVQIVKPALEPSSPINPPKTGATTSLGFIIGIILGVVFAFLIETFDTSMGAAEDVEQFLGAHVLGIIPHVDFDELKATLQEKSAENIDDDKLLRIAQLISHFAPKTTPAEGYRALRTNINFVKLEKDIKTITFTSSAPQEGKTTISVNLAITMAQMGKKVLLVDGDFRRPVISKIFGIQSVPGLTDVILGNYEWRSVVRSITDIIMGKMTMEEIMITPGLDNLYIMTCGTIAPNPAELISTRVNSDFIKESHEEYDFVIIDAPPILAATDAAIWGTKADGVIIVYKVGTIARGALKRAKAQVDNVKARLIGVVLNGLKPEISPDFEFHDKYYYYYGSEHERKIPLGEKISSLPEQIEKYAKNFPEKLKNFIKGKEKRKSGINTRSGFLKIVMLLLAITLLIAGLYYSGVVKRPAKAPPVRPGNVVRMKVKTAPAPVPTEAAVNLSSGKSLPPDNSFATSVEKSLPQQGPSATLINDAAGKSELAVSVPADRPYAIKVSYTLDFHTAEGAVDALKAQGHEAYIVKVDLNEKGIWYRIFIGPFASENEARQYILEKNIAVVYPGWIIYKDTKIVAKAKGNK